MKINYKYFSALYKALSIALIFSATTLLSAQEPATQGRLVQLNRTLAGEDQKLSEDSQVSDAAPYEPQDIVDAFAPNAVTLQDMELRAKHHPYMPGEIVVAMELGTSKSNAASVLDQFNWQGLFAQQGIELSSILMKADRGSFRSIALVLLSLPEDTEVFEAMKKLEGKSGVLWSSPNFYFEGDPREFNPNDPDYAAQYHHPLMKNDLAWDITLGSPSIVIGITDDGVELIHSDLATNIWVNTGEIPGNGIDDDGNGYIDDVNGWDFSSGNNDPNPNLLSDTHGTHVAGITAARTNNSIGIAGVAGQSTIMPLQFYAGGPWTAAIINETFTYAADNGAKIVNTSYNIDGWVGDPVFTAGLQYLYDAGVLHLNSAGNNNQLNPPRQAFQQTLLVASTDAADVRSGFSNYGVGIDISAPGSLILSTVTGNSYDFLSGTSMATPNAAGTAALIWSANPSWTRDQVAAQLLATADNIDAANPTLVGLLGSGRVNSYAALTSVLAAPKVKSIPGLPDEGTIISANDLTSFSVAFDQVMDPTSVNNMANFELRNAGPNEIFGDGDDLVHPLTTTTTYQIGTNQLSFQISDLPLQCGLHRLKLVSGGLENPFGTDLDGDGNGVGGDDFVRNFSVVDVLSYFDGDGDGYGAGSPSTACPPPPGYVLLDGDCDDSDPLINPGATEICDGVDNNCDGIVDFPPVETYVSSDVPVAIPNSGTPTISSTLIISGATGNIIDLNVKDLNILHTYVGDLKVTLTSPGGTVLVLFDRPGYPTSTFGCSQNNIFTTFDDEASLTAVDFENTCNSSTTVTPPHTYAISGTYQSIDALSALNGTSPDGTWTLTVSDFYSGDGGSIEGWGLEISVPSVTNTYYADADGDSYGDPNVSIELACTPDPLLGWVLDNSDCEDTNPDINPAATEVCDGMDNNCDGQIDEGNICCPSGEVLFVDAGATGLNNGSSWTDAFTDLQDALNSICPGITEIWVAAGTYYPTSGIDRNISFIMKNNLAIFGGFEGTEDPLTFDIEDRNFVANETILSGDIGIVSDNSDNSYTVVTGSGTNATAIIDGFSITGGNSNSNDFSSLPTSTGGGMINSNGSPTVTNCSFSGNSASYGGGMMNFDNSSPTITNCRFSGNSAEYGGGMYFFGDGFTGDFRMVNCLFYNNSASNGGGAIGYDDQSGGTFEIINTTFYNNTTAVAGGLLGIHFWDSGFIPPVFTNCIGWGNSSTFGQTSANQGIAVFNNTLIQETDCPAGATCNSVIFGQDPLFEDTFTNNFQLSVCSPAINSGSNVAVPTGIATDLDGNARIFGGTVDMGAYESHFCETVSVAIVNPDFEILYKAGSTTITSPPLTNAQEVFGPANLSMEGPTVTFSDNTTGNMFDMAGWTFNTLMGVTNRNSNFTDPRDMIVWMNGASFGGGTEEKTMSQILSEDVQQNAMYELTADFGWRNDNGSPSPPVLRLYAGATLLTPVTSVDPPLVQGGFVTYSRTYYVDDMGISGPLRIEFGMAANTDGQQLNTDRIRLTKTPEDCTLLPGVIASSQTICSGNMPDPFTSISPASGIVGDLEYQWQISTEIPNFEDIAGAVSETYTHTGTITQTTWFRRLAKVTCQTEWVASNEVQVDVDPLPIAIISDVIDDFEVADLPNGMDPYGNGVGFITFGDFWTGTTVEITTTQVADTDPLAMPGQSGDNYLLRFDANVNEFGGLTHAFENEDVNSWVTKDWSGNEGIAFWLYGQNTGKSLYFEIQDNRNPGSTIFDVELWTYTFTDNFSGWKLFALDFNDFTRKEIGNGAPNDGFGREEVHGWVFGVLNTGGATVTYYLDNVMVYGDGGPFCPYTTIEFSAPAGMATYAWSLSVISGSASIGSWDDFLGFTPGADNEQDVQVVGVCSTVFTLTLTVTDAQGCSASTQHNFVVEESGIEWVNEPQDYSVSFNVYDLEAEVQNWLNSMEASSSCFTVNAAYYLQLLQVNSPGDIQEYFISGKANFGPSEFNVTGDLEIADPALACDPLLNDLTNKIAIIDRGICTFTSKVKNAQDAGAIAAIVINSNPEQGVVTMGGTDPSITIPSLFISYEDGLMLKDAIQQGLVNVTLSHFIDLQPGDYPVLFRAATQCQVIEKTVTLHIEETPANLDLNGLVIGENDSECFGATQDITVQDVSVDAGGSLTLIAGNSIIITPGFNVAANGYFHAYISDEYCVLPASLLALESEVENNPALDFNENLSDDLRIFPNPTTGGFTIEMGEAFGSNKTSVSIYNMIGELILTNENVLNQAEFNLAGYPNGIYVILIRNNENTEIRKLIKQ